NRNDRVTLARICPEATAVPTGPRVSIDSCDVPRTLSRESIVEVARDLLIEEGLAGVSLRRVATSLGVTAPALYAHVTDKRDLLQSIADGEFQRLVEAFESVVSDDPV